MSRYSSRNLSTRLDRRINLSSVADDKLRVGFRADSEISSEDRFEAGEGTFPDAEDALGWSEGLTEVSVHCAHRFPSAVTL